MIEYDEHVQALREDLTSIASVNNPEITKATLEITLRTLTLAAQIMTSVSHSSRDNVPAPSSTLGDLLVTLVGSYGW